MATLNTSAEGPSINRSYKSVVDASEPTGPAASSPTYGQWALFSVAAPLASAFADSGKESVLKVQSTGDGELADLLEDFSDGRIQFAFVKVKDPNTTLRKSVLVAWCGEGVPERTKGYFTSHLAAVSKIFHGYHVQVTARADSDLSPEGIIKKVSDSSGSKYSGDTAPTARAPPPVASKPVFTPSRVAGGTTSFAPIASRSRQAQTGGDGWGDDEQSTRNTLEKVQPAYQPTKVDMASLTSQKQESRFQAPARESASDVVKGGYQPIGKVDIAALRREAQSSSKQDDRPTIVKGAYEPVGKVDIAAIRAKAQPPSASPPVVSPAVTGTSAQSSDEPKSLADRSAAFSASGDGGRLTSLPKPKVANRFGSGFTGTKAPAPGGFEAKSLASAAPVGVASRTFADEGGKTPAQIWAEKKARERGNSGAADTIRPTPTVTSQTSGGGGGGQWESGYTGKKWGEVQLPSRTGTSAVSQEKTGDEPPPAGGVSSIRDRFKDTAPEDREAPAPPPMDLASKPNAGLSSHDDDVPAEQHQDLPPPPAQPRSPTPPDSPALRPSSPIRIAQPISSSKPLEAPVERLEDEPVPIESLAHAVPREQDIEDEEPVSTHDPARAAGQAAAASTFGASAHGGAAGGGAAGGGKSARAEYDYQKAEDNEIAMAEGELITNIDMVDEDWWMGTNSQGESGLFPMNYVTLLEDDSAGAAGAGHVQEAEPEPEASAGPTATAEYDYEAAEENELSFPEGATITEVEFPDSDWWHVSLFPPWPLFWSIF
ncbi:hypothetical protein FH972_024214 [Carpinus fangiana]|uniref:ADF-H domain-containing protein n=1 Tax=Carpinus fangiana TaxID=176857 RepID=A0A5N6KXW9_9ROSI|nr:hypothetical protein FH972_024214 [Carpinus fangiana]